MTVPARVEAASLLLSLDPPDLVRAARARRRGGRRPSWRRGSRRRGTRVIGGSSRPRPCCTTSTRCSRRRSGPRPPPWRGIGCLADPARSPGAGPPVAGHPVTRLARRRGVPALGGFAAREERIVAYADKRAGQRLESMDARFASWRRRYPGAIAATAVDRLGRRACDGPSARAADASRPTSAGRRGSARPRSAASRWTGDALAGRRRWRRRGMTPPARLVLGRRRTVGGPRGRSPRGGARHRDGRAARALGPARRPRPGREPGRPAQRAGRDAGHVRRRHAGRRHGRRSARPHDRTARRAHRDPRARRPRQWPRLRRVDADRREGSRRRRSSPMRSLAAGGQIAALRDAEGRQSHRLDRARGARAGRRPRPRCGEGDRGRGSGPS